MLQAHKHHRNIDHPGNTQVCAHHHHKYTRAHSIALSSTSPSCRPPPKGRGSVGKGMRKTWHQQVAGDHKRNTICNTHCTCPCTKRQVASTIIVQQAKYSTSNRHTNPVGSVFVQLITDKGCSSRVDHTPTTYIPWIGKQGQQTTTKQKLLRHTRQH